MADLKYGTVGFYEDQFSDLLADVDSNDPCITENIIEGFYRALDSWFDYHYAQANEYAAIRKRVREALAM